MSKIKLNAKLISEDDKIDLDVTGIKTKNKIVYKEGNVTVTIEIIDKIVKINRLSKEYEINLTFDMLQSTISTYSVFGAPKIFELETKTKKLNITDDKIEIDYILEGNEFYYTLKIGG